MLKHYKKTLKCELDLCSTLCTSLKWWPKESSFLAYNLSSWGKDSNVKLLYIFRKCEKDKAMQDMRKISDIRASVPEDTNLSVHVVLKKLDCKLIFTKWSLPDGSCICRLGVRKNGNLPIFTIIIFFLKSALLVEWFGQKQNCHSIVTPTNYLYDLYIMGPLSRMSWKLTSSW